MDVGVCWIIEVVYWISQGMLNDMGRSIRKQGNYNLHNFLVFRFYYFYVRAEDSSGDSGVYCLLKQLNPPQIFVNFCKLKGSCITEVMLDGMLVPAFLIDLKIHGLCFMFCLGETKLVFSLRARERKKKVGRSAK